VIVLLLEDVDLAEFGVGHIDSAVLCPRNAIASRQAIHRNLATLVHMTVPYGSPGKPEILDIPGLGKMNMPLIYIPSSMSATYKAKFDAVVIGEVKAFPIRRAHEVIRSVDNRTLDGLQMGERVPTDRSLEYFNDGIRADLLRPSIDRLPMVDCVDEELFRVYG
jgi:hypothetical protein